MKVDWFHGTLTEVFGIPSFWIARLAKIIQFVSGAIIVIEILGKEKTGELADTLRQRLAEIADAEPVKLAANDLRDEAKYFLRYVTTKDKKKREEIVRESMRTKSGIPAAILTLLFSIGITYAFYFWQLELEWGLIWKLPLTLIVSLLISLYFIYLIFLNLISFIIFIIFHPIEIGFDKTAKLIANILEKEKVVRRLLILSFCLLILSFFFELVVT